MEKVICFIGIAVVTIINLCCDRKESAGDETGNNVLAGNVFSDNCHSLSGKPLRIPVWKIESDG